MASIESKVFGIGLSKTGTSSLNVALNELGIRSIHFPRDPVTHSELASGHYRLSILHEYQAATDIPVAAFFAQLDEAFPNSKFILTVRDVDGWLSSVKHHWEFTWRWADNDREFRDFLEFMTACMYGVHRYQRERFLYVYHRHLREVREFFQNRPNDLLILNICAGDGWEKLCPFLDLPIPDRPFPATNRREEKTERIGWVETLTRAIEEFEATIPTNEPYVLVDDEQLAGSGLEKPGQARRLIEKNGLCWGPPVDSLAAITELEKLRAQGFKYFVITWTCFWWLDHYSEFRAYLNDRFRAVLNNERLLIIDLQSSSHH